MTTRFSVPKTDAESVARYTDREFDRKVQANQRKLRAALRGVYDFVVCGSGSSGSVVARRLAENPAVQVLLVEAGGADSVPPVVDPTAWPTNIGTDRDWCYTSEPEPALDGRRLQMSMGKVLGGGSSINAMVWSRGHARDWDLFAAESGDPGWSYQSILDIYRRIEDWHGDPDPAFRGTGGEVFVQPAPDPHPVALAMLHGAKAIGVPHYENANGRMMESGRGVALGDLRLSGGQRLSAFRTYTYPLMDRPNLTVLPGAMVTRVIVDGRQTRGVEIIYRGQSHRILAAAEVVLSLGAINTPKVLMLSGLGDRDELREFGVDVEHHLPGVGKNLQDHTAFDCVWEYPDGALPLRNNGSEVVVFERITPSSDGPDIFIWQAEAPLSTPENIAQYGLPESGWTLFSAIAHPHSRGQVRLSGADPLSPPRIHTNALAERADVDAALACIALSREIGNSAELRPYVKREIMPGDLHGDQLEAFVRNATRTFWHQCGTAKMGRDPMSVVDGELKVHGVEGLRIADASVMPRITTGNTMAPCVIIGERAAQLLRSEHRV
ncbi:GMC family oxidoreductase [Mycobacterium sp. E1747]|uniref:GMC family oxidoreductase n=1 Tax=Mycobacterium sp. E1747 TaxID=1834128 RepID=UPI0009EE1BDE|nr:GMC family oxidoreductase N-terminal domain-containing protein [Mycobacterium sp. E1747]